MTAPHPTIYADLLAAMRHPIEELMSFLETSIASGCLETPKVLAAGFVQRADAFASECSRGCAGVIRKTSTVAEVRATPTATLAGQIRNDIFHQADSLCSSITDVIRASEARLSNHEPYDVPDGPGLASSALQGAANGQLAAGLGRHGKTLGFVGAALAVSDAIERQAAHARRVCAQAGALLNAEMTSDIDLRKKVFAYVESLPQITSELLDYGSTKCLGAAVDFDAQQSAAKEVDDLLSEYGLKLSKLVEAECAKAEASARADEEKVKELKAKKEADEQRTSAGCGGVLIIVGLCFLAGIVSMFRGEGQLDEVAVTGVFLIGIISFFTGIAMIFQRSASSNSMSLMECPECGKNVSSEASACPSCGCPVDEPTSVECPECGEKVSESATACPVCDCEMTDDEDDSAIARDT